jgi:hypothetical protein
MQTEWAAGPDVEIAVADALGYRVRRSRAKDGSVAIHVSLWAGDEYLGPVGHITTHRWVGAVSLWQPSRDIRVAWDVIVAMQDRGWWARLLTPFDPADPLYFCGFAPHGISGWNGRPDFEAGAETAPLAICRAALMTLAAQHPPASAAPPTA